MTIAEAAKIIRRARLNGFGGNCGRVAIAINRVLFDGEGVYVIATNHHVSRAIQRPYVGHVVVEWKGRLFDATGVIDDEVELEAWGMVDPVEWDGIVTEDEAHDGVLWYSSLTERQIMTLTSRASCSIRDAESALRSARRGREPA